MQNNSIKQLRKSLLDNVHSFINKETNNTDFGGYYSLGNLKSVPDYELVLSLCIELEEGSLDRTIWTSPCIYIKNEDKLLEIHNYWEVPYLQQKEWVDYLISKVSSKRNLNNANFYEECDDLIVKDIANKKGNVQEVQKELQDRFNIELIG